MKRLTIGLAVALLISGIGALLWFASSSKLIKPQPSEPLRVVLSQERKAATANFPVDHYIVTVENVSSRTVQGYSLGHTCDCRAQGTHGPYPEGISFSNPNPDRQLLKPGESQTQIVSAYDRPFEQVKVWVDLVHFTDGTNWGPNQSRTEGYVRALN